MSDPKAEIQRLEAMVKEEHKKRRAACSALSQLLSSLEADLKHTATPRMMRAINRAAGVLIRARGR